MALLFFVMAVLIAAAIGGRAAGLVTTFLSLAVAVGLIIRPEASAGLAVEFIRASVFTVEGIAISVVMDRLQRSAAALRAAAGQVELERERVERMALEDYLTNLGNRRAFRGDLRWTLAQSLRDRAPLTVMIADIDGLKRVNDTEGHERGDELLVAVARAISSSSRTSDSAYRIGGDEFALLMPSAGPEEYEAMLKRLRQSIAQVGAEFNGAGVSVGAAHKPEDGEDADQLARIADTRMYEAKSARSARGHV